jgi:hypothetical protein
MGTNPFKQKKIVLVRSCLSRDISGMRFTYCCVGIMVTFRNNDTQWIFDPNNDVSWGKGKKRILFKNLAR